MSQGVLRDRLSGENWDPVLFLFGPRGAASGLYGLYGTSAFCLGGRKNESFSSIFLGQRVSSTRVFPRTLLSHPCPVYVLWQRWAHRLEGENARVASISVACERRLISGCRLSPPNIFGGTSDSRKYVCVRRLLFQDLHEIVASSMVFSCPLKRSYKIRRTPTGGRLISCLFTQRVRGTNLDIRSRGGVSNHHMICFAFSKMAFQAVCVAATLAKTCQSMRIFQFLTSNSNFKTAPNLQNFLFP